MKTKIGDIVERLPSRIVQVVSYWRHADDGHPAAVLCADGSVWQVTGRGGWQCTEPPHVPEPETDWQARALEAGAALARVTAERDDASQSIRIWRGAANAASERADDTRSQLDTACAEADAQRERAAAAEAARQLAEHRCTEMDRARVEAVAQQIQAVAKADRLRADLTDTRVDFDATVYSVRRVLSGELTKPYPGTLAYEVAQALQSAVQAEREVCASICDREASSNVGVGAEVCASSIRSRKMLEVRQ